MVKSTSLADYMADWRRLLSLVEINVNQGLLPDMPALRGTLQDALLSLERASSQQDSIRAQSKDNAAESRTHLHLGSDAALQLRAAIRAHLGPRNPMLAEFRVRVLAPRRPKPTPPEDKAPATPRRGGRRRKVKAETEAEAKEAEPEAVSS